MAGVAQLPFAFRPTKCVAARIEELYIGQVIRSWLKFNCPSFNDQDSRFTIQHSRLVNLLLLRKVDLRRH